MLFQPATLPAELVQPYADGTAHCASSSPDACDYVSNNRSQMNFLTLLLILFAGFRAGQMLIVDLGQLGREQLVFVQHVARVRRAELRVLARVLNGLNTVMRAYVIPCWACAAINMIVISWAPTTRNVLFGGVVVASAFTLDTLVSQAVMGIHEKQQIRSAVEGATLMVRDSNAACRSPTLESLAFDLSGDGSVTARPAQRIYCLLLSIGVAIFLLLGADPFVPSISWLVLLDPFWQATSISETLSMLSVLPCTSTLYVAMYLPLLITLLAIPLELFAGTYAEDAPISAGYWPRRAQACCTTALSMLTTAASFTMICPCLSQLQFRNVGLA